MTSSSPTPNLRFKQNSEDSSYNNDLGNKDTEINEELNLTDNKQVNNTINY